MERTDEVIYQRAAEEHIRRPPLWHDEEVDSVRVRTGFPACFQGFYLNFDVIKILILSIWYICTFIFICYIILLKLEELFLH